MTRQAAEAFARYLAERDGIRMRIEQETGLDGRVRYWPVMEK